MWPNSITTAKITTLIRATTKQSVGSLIERNSTRFPIAVKRTGNGTLLPLKAIGLAVTPPRIVADPVRNSGWRSPLPRADRRQDALGDSPRPLSDAAHLLKPPAPVDLD